MDDEVVLSGGNASGRVVRVGSTVRKPWQSTTPRVIGYLTALEGAGIDVPRPLGRDGRGRFVLEHVPGTMAVSPLPDDAVRRVGSLVRRIHDASAAVPVPDDWPDGVLPAPRRELVCHNDLATWNLVLDGERMVFIDWDAASPSSRDWDLAYAAISFAHLFPDAEVDGTVDAAARRLKAFVDGYDPQHAETGLRAGLPGLMVARSTAMHDLLRISHQTGAEPWAGMFVEGHGEHWRTTTAFLDRWQDVWRATVGG